MMVFENVDGNGIVDEIGIFLVNSSIFFSLKCLFPCLSKLSIVIQLSVNHVCRRNEIFAPTLKERAQLSCICYIKIPSGKMYYI